MKKVFFLLAITFALTLSATATTVDNAIGIEQVDMADLNPMVFVAVETVAEIVPNTVSVLTIDASVEAVTVNLFSPIRSDEFIHKSKRLFKTPKSKLVSNTKQVKNYLTLTTNWNYRNI